MQSKAQKFLELTKTHKETLLLLCELLQTEADLKSQMVLNYLEFSGGLGNYNEFLALKIANEAIKKQLSELSYHIELTKINVKYTKKLIQRLV